MQKIFKLIDGIAYACVLALFSLLLLVGAWQVAARFFGSPPDWSEELLKFAHVWLVFIAIPIAYNRGAHICVDMISTLFPKAIQKVLALVVDILWIAFAAIFIYYTDVIIGVAKNQTSAGLQIPMSYVYFGMVIGTGYLLLCALRSLTLRIMNFSKPEVSQ